MVKQKKSRRGAEKALVQGWGMRETNIVENRKNDVLGND